VIGAGISGLSAAKSLKTKGYNVTVLEAKNYIGGRIKTHDFNGIKLEMGASWVHGQIGNPVGKIVKKQGGRLVLSDYKPHIYYNKKNKKFNFKKGILKKFYDNLKAIKKDKVDQSILNAWNTFVKESLKNSKKYTPSLIGDLFQTIIYDFQAEVGGDLSEISAQQWDEDGELEGGDHLVLKGYERVTEFLANGLNIILNTPIKKIEDNKKSVKVTTVGGTEYIADYVVVSVSLGVLKSNSITFIPALPKNKKIAIDTIKMSNFLKTWLVFEKDFWSNAQDIQFFTNHLFLDFFNPLSVSANHSASFKNPILLAMHGGKQAEKVRGLTSDQISQKVYNVLEKVYGGKTTKPTVHQSSWHNDQYTLGSYSFIPVGGNISMYDDMAKPYGKIYFAGEHTFGRFHATTHGAFWSGKRAAIEIDSRISSII